MDRKYLEFLIEAQKPKVKIPVEHEDILEVPEGKKVNELPYSHFAKLAKEKGYLSIVKALNNLHVWNRKRNPELADWADKMQNRISKEFGEEE